MSAIAWWLIPLVATLLAIMWASWATRQRTPRLHDSSENYERFQAALGRNYRPPADELNARREPRPGDGSEGLSFPAAAPPAPPVYRQE